MRICDAIARQVAITKWNDIKEDLEEGSKVSILIISLRDINQICLIVKHAIA
jgi:hypothetical protein